MDFSGEMTTTQRIATLEKAVTMARREVSVALLKVLATSTIGERDERGSHPHTHPSFNDNHRQRHRGA